MVLEERDGGTVLSVHFHDVGALRVASGVTALWQTPLVKRVLTVAGGGEESGATIYVDLLFRCDLRHIFDVLRIALRLHGPRV